MLTSFSVQRPVAVPLWLAVTLRTRKKCAIRPPDWLTKEFLRDKLDTEKTTDLFSEMPDHFQEIAALLFECASTDIRDSELVRTLLADIHDVRYSKTRKGLANAKDSEIVKMNNLSLLEISAIRPFFVKSLDTFFRLDATVAVVNDGGSA
jgi:GINS complex subunit 2